MADRRLAIEITVEGDAERRFKVIGQAAKSSAQDIEQSSQRAKQGIERIEKAADAGEQQVKELEVAQQKAAKAADDLARQSEKSAKSMDRYKDAISKTQQGMALLGTAFTMYAGQARQHEITVNALERIYGEAADSYIRYADQIQNTSIFSNDEALEAARIMGTLRENYDLTDQQIQQLIQTSADLATMHGFTLSDAAMRVQSAIRGEAESAEALGLTMNQAAIDAQGLTLTMSNAEAAQFRFDAMMQQTTSSVGAAAEAIEDNAGKTQQLANKAQDAALRFVEFTGPVGQAASGLAAFGLQGGLAATGLIQLGRGFTTAAAAAGGFTALMGPAGLVVLGLGAATTAGILLARAMRDDVAEAMKAARLEGEELDATISALTGNLSGLDLQFASTIVGSDDALDQLLHDMEYWAYLVEKWKYATGDAVELMNTKPEWFAELDAETQDMIRKQALEQGYIDQYVEMYGSQEEAAKALAEAERDLNSILTHRGAGREEILSQLSDLNDAYQSQRITIADYIVALDLLESQMYEIDNDVILDQLEEERRAAEDAARAIKMLRMEQQLWNGADYLPTTIAPPIDTSGLWSGVDDFVDGVGLVEETIRKLMARQNRQGLFNSDDIANYADEVLRTNKAYADLIPEIDQSTRATLELDSAFGQVTGTMKGELGVSIAELNAQFEEAVKNALGVSDALYDIQSRGGVVPVNLAINTGNAQSALQSGFNAIVGGTNAMGQLADQTWQWSNSLTEGITGQSKLDQLLLDGVISQKTYGEALDANHRIMKANESVQEDVLRIQAKQLPVLAQLAEEHARYVDQLADEDVFTQTVALGYMDQTKAAQAMQLAQVASSAAMAGTTEAASKMILQMAEGDPILKAMLVDMGLLSETDGKLEVNFGDVESADKAMKELNSTLETLTTVIAKAFNIDVKVLDGASGPLATIWNYLQNIDGKTVTAYANVVGADFGSLAYTGTFVRPERRGPSESLMQQIANSGVPSYSTGGQVTLVGEVGPELVTLPAGSTVTNAAGTRGRLNPRGRGRRGSQGDTIINKGTVHMTVVQDYSALRDRARRKAGGKR